MRVNRILLKTQAEGPGQRACIWVQGCKHKCEGCFAEELWDFNGGYEISADEIIVQLKSVSDEICGITFLGGEPFEYACELSKIAEYMHRTGKSVITFTGYSYETIVEKELFQPLINETDLLIDGRFDKNLTDYSRPLVGSSNQRFIYLTDKISKADIDNYKNRFEIRFTKDGKAMFNGMGNLKKFQKYLNSIKENN